VELRVIGRGALAGFIAGVLGFVFARIFAEPFIDKAIDYESGRHDALNALNTAAGRPTLADGPEIFSRTIQSTVGIATGVIALATAMGALIAVAYLVLHGRFRIRPRNLAWLIAGFGFLGVYLLPYVKYPANPPSIGHTFTIGTRSQLYLSLVGASLVLLALAAYLACRLAPRLGTLNAILLSTVAFLIVYGTLIGLLPSLGDLPANVAHTGQFGYARAATETPQPITNILSTPVVVDGQTYAPGQVVYPGFDADALWKFRWYSLLDQILMWAVTALVFGALLERLLNHRTAPAAPADPAPVEPANVDAAAPA
jgi:hypothetical protein